MASPIKNVAAGDEQHLLFLFVPLKKGKSATAAKEIEHLQGTIKAHAASVDPRAATGVHFFMIYHQADGQATPGIPVPGFQSFPGKDVLVVMSLYDNDFAPYISAFFTLPPVVAGLTALLQNMDESGIPGLDPKDPSTAANILKNGGVVKNPSAFYCLLMRYNFADPTLAAGAAPGKYTLGATFPGLTVGKILNSYPDAKELWPFPPVAINFQKSVAPKCGK
ncbi:hypothetical protein ACFGVR_01995 [Mucilaginibacter sp. AW1-3]